MATQTLSGIQACVFDAYGTLFDFNAAVAGCRDQLGDDADRLSELWRQRQLQYTWLRSLMRRHVDFWQVTGEALDYALTALKIDNPKLRRELMDLYRRLDAFEEVPEVLKTLKAAGIKTAILSNGSPSMLADAVQSAGLAETIDLLLSVEEVGVYKPDSRVYQLALDRLGVPPSAISFQSSNAWDAAGAATYGFAVIWINRYAQPPENLPGEATIELTSLRDLPACLGL